MPEQEKTAVVKRVFCAGFYTFCAAVCLLQLVYRGNFPEIFPPFLVFFAAFAFNSYSGRISGKKYLHFIVLLIYSGLVLWFKEPLLFALVSGLSAGTFSADAFANLPDNNKWAYAIRDYLSGGICGIMIACLGNIALHFAILPALILYALSIFCQKSENSRSGWAYATAFLLFLMGFVYVSNKYQTKIIVPAPKEKKTEIQVSPNARDVSIVSLAHLPVEKVLLIQPDYLKKQKPAKKSEQKSNQTVIHYPDFFTVQERLISDKNRYDLIVVTQNVSALDQFSREFIGLLKSHLTPHGVVIYLLSDDDLFRTGALRASMQLNFKHIRTSGKLRLMAASDFPLKKEGSQFVSDVLEHVFYTREWEEQTAAQAAAVKAPTSSNYAFERSLLSRETTNPLLRAYYDCLPRKTLFLGLAVSGLLLCYLIVRYMTAYVSGMGLRLTVFIHSVLFFFIAGYLFFARSLNGFPYGAWYCIALCPLLISGILGCYMPVKYYHWGLPILLAVGIVSWLLMPHYGMIFIVGVLLRCLMIGFILPSMLWNSTGKYKTGTVEPSVLLESTSSGLFVAAILLAMMP